MPSGAKGWLPFCVPPSTVSTPSLQRQLAGSSTDQPRRRSSSARRSAGMPRTRAGCISMRLARPPLQTPYSRGGRSKDVARPSALAQLTGAIHPFRRDRRINHRAGFFTRDLPLDCFYVRPSGRQVPSSPSKPALRTRSSREHRDDNCFGDAGGPDDTPGVDPKLTGSIRFRRTLRPINEVPDRKMSAELPGVGPRKLCRLTNAI